MLNVLLLAVCCSGPQPEVLVFTRTVGFRHGSVDRGSAAIAELGEGRWGTTRTEDPTAFTPGNLSEYDAVVFLNTTMDVLDDRQQSALQAYLESGGGWLGIHAAADTEYDWPFYGDALLGGAWFKTHPRVQQATVKIEDQHHPAMVGLPLDWPRTDEWYDYRVSPRGNVHVLATLDETTYSPRAPMVDHPIAWSTAVGNGTALYTGGGHTVEAFDEPLFRQHLSQSLEFVMTGGWIDLIDSNTTDIKVKDAVAMEGDGFGTMEGWRTGRWGWWNVGAVHIDPDDPSKLLSSPGSGVLCNFPPKPSPDGLWHAAGEGLDQISDDRFGDCALHLEWMMPEGSNSGIYVQGCYEVQILDSWGVVDPGAHDAGGVYQRWDPARGEGKEGFEGHAPRVNAARKPGRWQSFDIVFRAARWNAEGEKIRNARFERVVHNGIVIHEDVELKGPTRGGYKESPGPGPLRLQGDHGLVAYRNIRVRRLGP